MRYPGLLFMLLFACISLHAQVPTIEESEQKFIHYIDPMGLVLIEVIEPGMTFYGYSRKYNVSIDSMMAANPDLDHHAIPMGYPINIPIYPKAISSTPPTTGEDSIPIFYRVQPKETLYRISKVYLGISPEVLISLNPRIDEGLSIGQVLHLGWYIPARNVVNPVNTSPAPKDSTQYSVTDFAQTYETAGDVVFEQKGLAVWKAGNMQSHYYVLHPTARVGSYMEVTNPMLHRTLTAKVAGNIPPGLYQPQVGLVVSPSVARALGVLDQQFFAKWRFVE